MSTVVPGKGQKWPAHKRRAHHVETFLAQRRDQQEVTLICGLEGCSHTLHGRFVETQARLAQHRGKKHPEWKPPARRKHR